jgi:hypothetical protein
MKTIKKIVIIQSSPEKVFEKLDDLGVTRNAHDTIVDHDDGKQIAPGVSHR